MSWRSAKLSCCYCMSCITKTCLILVMYKGVFVEKEICVHKREPLINLLNTNYFPWLKLNETAYFKGKKIIIINDDN